MLAILVLVSGLILSLATVVKATPMGTSWNYQGRLMYANSPADGAYDFLFTLFDEPNGGSLLISVDLNDVNVIDGYFRVGIDFSSDVFDGNARWLEILVRPGDSNDLSDFVALSPRQEITPVPYALQTRGIFVDDTGRVGIGTTNPQSILQVGEASVNYTDDPDSSIGIDDSTPDAKLEITIAPDNTNKDFLMLSSTADEDGDYLIVKNHGYVGIGVTDPPNILSVLSASGGDGISVVDNSGYSKVLLSIAGGDWGFVETADGSSGRTRIAPNTSFFSGNVGIGTESPQGTLEVSHDSASHDLVVNSSTGNVGIGTESPNAELEIYRNQNYTTSLRINNPNEGAYAGSSIYFYEGGAYRGYIAVANSGNVTAVGGTRSLSIQSSGGPISIRVSGGLYPVVIQPLGGNVGIGTKSPNAELEVNGEIRISPDSESKLKIGRYSATSPSSYISTTGGAEQMRFQIGDSTKMVIDTSGSIGIGTTSPGSFKLYVNGTAYSTGGWVGSDRQFKENINTIESPLDKIQSIKGVSFEWKISEYKEKGFPEGRHFGVIAQEVEEVLPEIVKEGPDGDKAVSYTELVPILTEAIKQQQEQIENLQYEVKALKEIMNQHNLTVAK